MGVYALVCNPGERSICHNRGFCAPSGDICICDDYLHYWPSELCSIQHDGRELASGQYCFPDTVDYYCSWMGVCRSDGSECLCFDSEHRISGDRCLNWYDDLTTAAPSKVEVDGCSPGDRSFCNDRGQCSRKGDACECDDYLHYWPSEQCSTWHDGRELAPGKCCYPNTVDYYCSWMGMCSSDGSECICYDSQHRYNADRCFNWYMELPPVPTPAPSIIAPTVTFPVDTLHQLSGNDTCLFLTLIDNFGDGWKEVVLVATFYGSNYTMGNDTIDLIFTAAGCNEGYLTSGCLPNPLGNQSHTIALAMRNASCLDTDPLGPLPTYYWEIQWSVEIIMHGMSTGEKYFGGFDTILKFTYDACSESYNLQEWEEMWVYPEEEDMCGMVDVPDECDLFNVTLFDCANPNTTNTSTVGGNYEEAGWYISSLSSYYTEVNAYGIPWSVTTDFTVASCLACLQCGSYVFEVTGANYPEVECIHWSFCGIEGGAQERVYFDIINGTCVVRYRTDLDDACPQHGVCPPLVTSAPTPVSPPTSGHPTPGTPTCGRPTCPPTPDVPPTASPPTPALPTCGRPTCPPTPDVPPTASPPTPALPTCKHPTCGHPICGPPTGESPTCSSPSAGQPTSNYPHPTPYPKKDTIPHIISVTPRTWDACSSNLTVHIEVTTTPHGGYIFCAAFVQGTAPSSSYDIVVNGYGTSSPSYTQTMAYSTFIDVILLDLVPFYHYDIWCIAQDTLCNTDPLSEANKLAPLWVEYCKTTTLTTSPSGCALSHSSSYDLLMPSELQQFLVSFELDYSPWASVSVTPVVYQGTTQRYDVIAHPTTFTFTSADTGDALKGSFYLTGPPGLYTVQLEYASTGHPDEFCDSERVWIKTVSGGILDVLPVLPMLLSAQIDHTGQKLVLTFNKPTDYAISVVTSDSWDCSLVVSFSGANCSLCYWRNDHTIVAMLHARSGFACNHLTGVNRGDAASALGGVLKSACYKASCAADPFASESSVFITTSARHVTGMAVLVAPSVSLACLDLVLDPSMSRNHGGRNWQTVSWVVSAQDGSDVSTIQTLLNSVTTTALPITISLDFLHPTVYHFSLGVRNYMEAPTSDMRYTTVEVDIRAAGPVMSVSLAAPPFLEVEQSAVLVVDAVATVLDCVPTPAYSYKYTWTVFKSGVLTNVTSTSPNPAIFTVPGSVFDVSGGVYTITLLVETSGGAVLYTSRSITVYGTQTFVRARVSGGLSGLSIMSTEVLSLKGSESVGSSLSFRWTCQYTTAARFGDTCGLPSTASPSLSVPGNTFQAGATILFTLIVSAGSLASSAAVAVSVVAYHAELAVITLDPPTPPLPFNPANKLKLLATITSSTSTGADAVWTAPGSFLALNVASIVPVMQSFTHTTLVNGVRYPLGMRPHSLTGGKSYSLQLLVSQKVGQKFLVVDIQVNAPPSGGSFELSPNTGTAYDTTFIFSAPRWVDDADSLPLCYQFVYQIAPVFDWSVGYSRASAMRTFSHKTTELPAGLASAGNALSAGVIVRDIFGSDAWDTHSVIIAPFTRRQLSSSSSVQSSLSSLHDALLAYDLSAMMTHFQLSLNLLNDAMLSDCSLAPDCATLHRDICTSTAQTCGACLPGYSGVYGDSNYACHIASQTMKTVGSSCSVNAECEYSSCVNFKCVVPVKSCPRRGSSECSSHGTCAFSTSQGVAVSRTSCTVENTDCFASCICEAGYGGADCGLSWDEVTVASAQRGELCSRLIAMVSLIQPTKERLETFSDYLLELVKAAVVLQGDDIDKCDTALSSLSASLAIATVNLGRSPGQTAHILSELAFLDAAPALSSILEAVDALQEYTHTDMLPGQEAITYVTPNFRVGYLYPALSALAITPVIEAPLTEEEIAYGVGAYSVALPAGGLDLCGAFEDYASISVIVWARHPYYLDEAEMSGKLFSMSTFATGGTTANKEAVGDEYNYQIALFLNDVVDVSVGQPDCREYLFATGVTQSCASCRVEEFTSHEAVITCSDAADYFCPTSGASSRRASEHRVLQTSRDKGYYLAAIPLDFTTKSAESDEMTKSHGIFAFIIVFLSIVLGTIFLLLVWDRSDRRDFIALAAANRSRAFSSRDFNLSAAFDDGGQKSGETINVAAVAQVAADRRASSFSHSIIGSRNSKFSFLNPSGPSFLDRAGKPIPPLSLTKPPVLSAGLFDGTSTDLTTRRKKLQSEHVINLDNLAQKSLVASAQFRVDPCWNLDTLLTKENIIWSNLPPSSLLSEHDWFTRVSHAFGRHHKWARIFTYSSMRRSRVIRFLVAASDLMFVIFVNTVFYSIFYPDNSTCQDYSFTSPEKCLEDDGKFDRSESFCQWHSNGDCTLREPPFNVKFIVMVTMIVIVFAAIPRSIIQFVLETVCARRPLVEDVGLKSQDLLQSEPARHGDTSTDKDTFEIRNPSMGKCQHPGITAADIEPYALAQCDHMSSSEEISLLMNSARGFMTSSSRSSAGVPMLIMMDAIRLGLNLQLNGEPRPLTLRQLLFFGSPEKHIQWKVDKARKESVALVDKAVGSSDAAPDQFEWTDMVVMQHFIMEQLSPITRYCLKKSVFEMDHATPGRIGFFPWAAGWAAVLGCWSFMSYWIIQWTLTSGAGPARAWGLVLGIVLIADTVMNQLTQIYLLNVHMTDKLRPQLREIFGVLNDCLHMRLLKRVTPFDGARVVQHMSAACRAGRSPGVTENICAYVLALVDDIDVYLCRRHRLETLREVGIMAWLTLFHPALLNGTYDLCQQMLMDLVIPVTWCSFILLNYSLTLVSIYLLIAIWVIGVLVMIAFFFTSSQPHAYKGIASGDRKSLSRVRCMTANKDDIATIYGHSCLEQSSDASPLAPHSAVLDMSSLGVEHVLLGEEKDEVFSHHSDGAIVAEKSDMML